MEKVNLEFGKRETIEHLNSLLDGLKVPLEIQMALADMAIESHNKGISNSIWATSRNMPVTDCSWTKITTEDLGQKKFS